MNYTSDPLKLGMSGRAVSYLQRRLNVSMSGEFDVETETVLKRAQLATGNQADGVYGPMTNAALTMVQTSTLPAVAQTVAIDVGALHALLLVETVGRGFYTNGLPKILLERHYVYKLATAHERSLLPETVCNATPGGYQGGLAEWSRFDTVAAVDVNLAIQSCSWGIAQIMGIQCQRFNMSPMAFLLEQVTNEDTQIALLGRYITANAALRQALQQHDWAEVARLYNGADYAENHYDTKLATAYASFQG